MEQNITFVITLVFGYLDKENSIFYKDDHDLEDWLSLRRLCLTDRGKGHSISYACLLEEEK